MLAWVNRGLNERLFMSIHLLLMFTSSLPWHYNQHLGRSNMTSTTSKESEPTISFLLPTGHPWNSEIQLTVCNWSYINIYIYKKLVSYTLHRRARVSIPYKSAPAYTFRSQGCIIAICIGVTGVHLITQCHSCIESTQKILGYRPMRNCTCSWNLYW